MIYLKRALNPQATNRLVWQLVCVDLSTPRDSYMPRLVNPGDQEILHMKPVLFLMDVRHCVETSYIG